MKFNLESLVHDLRHGNGMRVENSIAHFAKFFLWNKWGAPPTREGIRTYCKGHNIGPSISQGYVEQNGDKLRLTKKGRILALSLALTQALDEKTEAYNRGVSDGTGRAEVDRKKKQAATEDGKLIEKLTSLIGAYNDEYGL